MFRSAGARRIFGGGAFYKHLARWSESQLTVALES